MSFMDQIGNLSNNINSSNSADIYDRIQQTVPDTWLGAIIGPAIMSLDSDRLRLAISASCKAMTLQQREQLLVKITSTIQDLQLDANKLLAGSDIDGPLTIDKVNCADLTKLLLHVQKTDPGLFNRVMTFYANQPALIKVMGNDVIVAIAKHLEDKNTRACAS